MTGLADSPFFLPPMNKPVSNPEPVQPAIEKPIAPEVGLKKKVIQNKTRPRNRDTMTPRNHDTVVSSNRGVMLPSNQGDMVEIVRKAVKELGKEAATHRFTVEEKKGVLDLIYAYKGSGVRTSENEVARIAINYLLEDYKQNGQNSILDKVLKALNE